MTEKTQTGDGAEPSRDPFAITDKTVEILREAIEQIPCNLVVDILTAVAVACASGDCMTVLTSATLCDGYTNAQVAEIEAQMKSEEGEAIARQILTGEAVADPTPDGTA